MSKTVDDSIPVSLSVTDVEIKGQDSRLARGPFKYDAYIGHSLPDAGLSEKICVRLKELAAVTTCPRYVRAEKDLNVLSRIKGGVFGSHKCVILITDDYLKEEWSESNKKNCLKDHWDQIEVQEVLSKATRFSTDMILVVALNNKQVIPEELRQFRLMRCDEDILSDKWINKLARKIKKEPIAELTVLPKDNVGYGAATGFYYGFLKLVLPGFRKRCLATMKDAFPNSTERFVTKMLIIMPTSCFCPPTMDSPGKIEFTNKFVVTNANRAGNMARDYKSSIYKFIVSEDDAAQVVGEGAAARPVSQKKDYYIVGELATPLLTMFESYYYGIVGMTRDQLDLERDVFFYTLQQILHHPNIKDVHEQFLLMWWNDEATSDGEIKLPLYDFLLPFIREEAKKESEERVSQVGAGFLQSDSAQVNPLEAGVHNPSYKSKNKLGEEDPPASRDAENTINDAPVKEIGDENQPVASRATKTFELLDVSGPNPAALYDKREFGEYEMDKAVRGKCLIINIYQFHTENPAVKQNNLVLRKGADRDSDMMRKLFESLKFDVHVIENINFKTFQETLLAYSVDVDHTDCNAFVCVIMTHGKLGEVFACDGISYRILDIADFFSGRRCKSLLGKPKLFFIQACQGGDSKNGEEASRPLASDSVGERYGPSSNPVPSPESSSESGEHSSDYSTGSKATSSISSATESTRFSSSESKPSFHQSPSSSSGVESMNVSISQPPQEIPVEKRACLVPGDPDFLMSYSTLPGSISYRDTTFGSLYVQALSNNLSKGYELDRALKLVSQEVALKLQEKRVADKRQYKFQLPFHLTTGMTKVICL